MAMPKSIETRVQEYLQSATYVTEFLWKTIGMHLVCKYSCYSFRYFLALPIFFITVTDIAYNLLESILHAK